MKDAEPPAIPDESLFVGGGVYTSFDILNDQTQERSLNEDFAFSTEQG